MGKIDNAFTIVISKGQIGIQEATIDGVTYPIEDAVVQSAIQTFFISQLFGPLLNQLQQTQLNMARTTVNELMRTIENAKINAQVFGNQSKGGIIIPK